MSLRTLMRQLTQFRLSTLIVLIAVVAIWLAIKFYREPMTVENLEDIQTLTKIEKDVWEIEWSADRSRLALVSWEKPVDVRETLTLLPVRKVGRDKKIIHFAFGPRPELVAYCENGTTVEIVDARAKKPIVIEVGSPQPKMEFSPDGTLLATGGYGSTAKIWRCTDGQLVHSCEMGGKGGLTVVFSPDGKTLAVGNRNSTTRLFDVATGNLLHEFRKSSSHGLAFHPSGRVIAIAYVDGSLVLWDTITGAKKKELKTTAKELYRVDWSRDGKLLASSGRETDITIWNGEDLTRLQTLESPEWVIGLKFSPDGTRLITAGGGQAPGSPREVRVWGVPPF